jgi:anti-sigma regulatory factor (Ser/Thr protein kinase)
LELILQNRPEEKQRLLSALEEFSEQHHLSPVAVQAADLALEEHLTNVMAYAYEDAAPHDIRIRLGVENQWLQIEIEDDGVAYDPLSRPPVDTSLPLEEKPIGGLGVHLIRSLMDEVDYRREAGRNILRMRKRVGGTSNQ